MGNNNLTAQHLREILDYDPETGNLTSRVNRGTIKIGQRLGSAHNKGYLLIGIDGKKYLSHRIAWLWMTGQWPKDSVDHMNGEKTDNRWSNLRDIPQSINVQNQHRAHRHARSNLLGATWHSRDKVWTAQININGKRCHLGSFSTDVEAHEAYMKAKSKYHVGAILPC